LTISMQHPSFFQLSLLLCLFVWLFGFLAMKARQFTYLGITLGLFLLLFFMKVPAIMMHPLHSSIGHVFGSGGVLSFVSEASSIFMHFDQFNLNFFHLNLTYLGYFIPFI